MGSGGVEPAQTSCTHTFRVKLGDKRGEWGSLVPQYLKNNNNQRKFRSSNFRLY